MHEEEEDCSRNQQDRLITDMETSELSRLEFDLVVNRMFDRIDQNQDDDDDGVLHSFDTFSFILFIHT